MSPARLFVSCLTSPHSQRASGHADAAAAEPSASESSEDPLLKMYAQKLKRAGQALKQAKIEAKDNVHGKRAKPAKKPKKPQPGAEEAGEDYEAGDESLSEDIETDDGEDSDTSDVSEEVLPSAQTTRSGRQTRKVERHRPEEERMLDDSDEDDDDADTPEAAAESTEGKKKKKTSKPKRQAKKAVNLTHGFCADDESFVIYMRMTGHHSGKIIGTATFVVSEYADAAFCAAAGSEPQGKTTHFCGSPAYLKDAGADRGKRIELRQKVVGGDPEPLRKFRASVIVAVSCATPEETALLAESASPFTLLPLRVKLKNDRLGFDDIGRSSVAPHFEFAGRVRGRVGVPMGVYEVERHVHINKPARVNKARACLAGLPLPQNVAFEFAFVDREPVEYTCANPSVAEKAALRPMITTQPPRSARTMRSWSAQSLYDLPTEVDLRLADQLAINTYTTLGKPTSQSNEPPPSKDGPCSAWSPSEAVQRLLVGRAKAKLVPGQGIFTSNMTLEKARARALVWTDAASKPVNRPDIAARLDTAEGPAARAVLAPFMDESFYRIARFVGFERALFVYAAGRAKFVAKRLADGACHELVVSPQLARLGRLPAPAEKSLLRRLAVESLLGETGAASDQTSLHAHKARLALDKPDNAELSRREQDYARLAEMVASLQTDAVLRLEDTPDTSRLCRTYMWPDDKLSPLAWRHAESGQGGLYVGWKASSVPIMATNAILRRMRAKNKPLARKDQPEPAMVVHADTPDAAIEEFTKAIKEQIENEPGLTHVCVVYLPQHAKALREALLRNKPNTAVQARMLTRDELSEIQAHRGEAVHKKGKRMKICVARADCFEPVELASILGCMYNGELGAASYYSFQAMKPVPATCYRSFAFCGRIVALDDDTEAGFSTGFARSPPLLSGCAAGGKFFDQIASLAPAQSVRRVYSFRPESIDALRQRIAFVPDEQKARDTVKEFYAQSTASRIVVPGRGQISQSVEQLRQSFARNFIDVVRDDAPTPFAVSAEKSLLVLPAHSSNPLWESLGFDSASPSELRRLLAGLLASGAKKVVVVGEAGHLFGRLVHERFWEKIDGSDQTLGFYCA